VEVEPGGELVDQALEPERALDEARGAKRLHRRAVQLRASLSDPDVLASVGQLQRATRGRDPAAPARGVDEVALERGESAVGACPRAEPLDRGVPVAGGETLVPAGEGGLGRGA